MTSRPSLTRSIPFWVLLVGSLVLTVVGAWLVLDRLGRIEAAIVSQSAEATVEVYVGQPAVLASAAVLGAGVIGLLLTLAVAAIATVLPRPAAPVIESIDWTSEEESAAEPVVAPVVAEPVVHAEPVLEADAAPASEEKKDDDNTTR